jgi:hypothetical protein
VDRARAELVLPVLTRLLGLDSHPVGGTR